MRRGTGKSNGQVFLLIGISNKQVFHSGPNSYVHYHRAEAVGSMSEKRCRLVERGVAPVHTDSDFNCLDLSPVFANARLIRTSLLRDQDGFQTTEYSSAQDEVAAVP